TLQLQYDLAGAVTLEPFFGDGRPGNVAAELLQFCTLIGAPAHRLALRDHLRGAVGRNLAWSERCAQMESSHPSDTPSDGQPRLKPGLSRLFTPAPILCPPSVRNSSR